MSSITFQSRRTSVTPEDSVLEEQDSILAEHLDELREANSRLQLLVCELLVKNQQLRFQHTDEQLALMAAIGEGAK